MLNHKQTTLVLAIGLVGVLMISASTRVFAQSQTRLTSQLQIPTEENKVNNVLQADENKIAADEHAIESKITLDASGGFQ